ncbi:hypothetical protein BOX15_Mlig011601g1, partial [Macrostomum lignano]
DLKAMFLLLNNGKREQQQQQQTPEPTQFGRQAFQFDVDDNFDASWDTPSSPMRRQQQQQRRQQQQQQQPKYYPENHPIHPEDERLNVKWPAKRETRAQQQQQQQQPSKSSGVQAGVGSADSDGSFEHRLGGRAQTPLSYHSSPMSQQFMPSPMQPQLLPPPPPLPQQTLPLQKQQQQQQPMSLLARPGAGPPPHQFQYQQQQPPQQQQQQQPLADQHLHRLFEEIYALRGEAETVQFKYRQERDAWAYENAVLQARLADLAQRAERQAGVEAAYSEELETLRAENRDLRIQMQEERLARELEAGDDAAAKSGTAAAAGDQATQQQVDQLVNELAALKRDLERLQHRYRTERDRWSARRRELEKAIDDLIAGKDPKAVQKRLKAAEAAEPKAEELHRSGFDPVADDDDLATATMAYYSSANTVKKEKAVLELELEDEKRKNRVLEIEVEVLRDQVMRANKKARGEAADDGEAEGAAGSRDADLPLEKGSVEASEKRRDSRRPSETPRKHERQDPYSSTPDEQQQEDQPKQKQKQAAVQQKLNEAHEELKAAAEERDQARAEGERLKAENERRREENKRMKDELVRAAEQEEKANEERKRDAEEKARLEDENRELKDKLDKQRRENDAEVDKLKQEKRRLEDKLRNIRDKMADGQKNYKHFQGEFEELAKLCE